MTEMTETSETSETSETVLPPLYHRWIDQLLGAPIAPETRATCQTCVMAVEEGDDAPDIVFKPGLKCCTYHPELPNYLVGRILADDRPEGAKAREVLEARIASRVGVTPYGLSAPASFTLVYQNAAVFGRADNMLCPFFVDETGGCGIYHHREGVCSTFFCRHNRAASGRAFWKVMNVLLKAFDVGLRVWCLDQIDEGGAAATGVWMADMARNKTPDEFSLAGNVSPYEYAWMWSRWAGREVEFYRRCAELVAPLDLEQVLTICGAQARAASRVVKLVHATVANFALPNRVLRGQGLVQIGPRPGLMRLKHAVAPYDQIDLPAEVLAAVPLMTGGPLAEVLAEMREEGLPIDDQTVRWLLDFEIIVPSG